MPSVVFVHHNVCLRLQACCNGVLVLTLTRWRCWEKLDCRWSVTMWSDEDYFLSPHICSGKTLGHPVMTIQHYLTTKSYVFYEVANSYDLTMILYDLSRPQWWVGLGAGLGVGHSYKFIWIVQLVKYVWKLYEFVRVKSYEWVTL